MLRIKELFSNVELLCLVGGEPFLNPELPKYCILCRELFPESKIRVITNGILLHKCEESLKIMEENNIELLITKYPIKIKLDMSNFPNLKYSFTPEMNYFTKKLTLTNDNNAKKAYRRCHERICHYLENGKIYGCTLFGRVKKLNEVFETNYPDVGIDIYSIKDGHELNNMLENVFSYCSYCSKNYETVKWSCNEKPDLVNYIVTKPDSFVFKMKMKLKHLLRTN